MTRCRDLNALDPQFRRKVDGLLAEAETLGLDIFVTETWRSDADQYEDFRSGESHIDGKKIKSMHQQRKAIDIGFRGQTLYPKDIKRWQAVYDLARKWGMQSGWEMWEWDKPHLQDNGIPLAPVEEVSGWARASVEKAKKKGITKWDDPREIVGTATLLAMLHKLDLLRDGTEAITKEEMAVVFFRAKLL